MVTGSRHSKRDALSSNRKVAGLRLTGSTQQVIHDMKTRTLVMELRRRAIKRWVPCGDMDCRLMILHSAKVECGFRPTPVECLYDSGLIGLQYRAKMKKESMVTQNLIASAVY